MRRIGTLVLLLFCGFSLGGCAPLGWYRSIGHFPGVAPSDYAFYTFFGTSSQLFQFTPPQVASSAMQAMGDLGFKLPDGPEPAPDGVLVIHAKTPDGRCADVTFTPQNNLTNMRIKIGPVCIGDQMLSHDVFKRVAINFGTLPRDYTPVERTLPHRSIPPPGLPPQVQSTVPDTLKGEGLRPGEQHYAAGSEEVQPGSVAVPGLNVPGPGPYNPLLAPSGGFLTPFYPFTLPTMEIPPTTYDTSPQ
jgi:hypothetical protein